MDKCVARLSIPQYRTALAEEEDEDRREILALLMAEEGASLVEASNFDLVWSGSRSGLRKNLSGAC
jgi:hypothetical protein